MNEPPPLPPANQRPHPVVFDVEYPERLSRGLIFVKWLLAFPHYIVLWLLGTVAWIIWFLAWFVILFTGRYPKGMFDIAAGYLRWSANVGAYTGLLRDEYPPFSLDPGTYPLVLDIPRAEQQSRWRLFIRLFAIIPNIVVLYFVQLAGFVATFIAWWAILFTGRYPRGLFRFNVGVTRWSQRAQSYAYLLRDEYPPYSINAEARPGNEVLSAIIGLPLGLLLLFFYIFVWFGWVLAFTGDGETVQVGASASDDGGVIAREQPTASGGGLEITLTGYNPDAITPDGGLGVSFVVEVEKTRWLPVVYIPWLFSLDYCDEAEFLFEEGQQSLGVADVEDSQFEVFFFGEGGDATSTIYFEGPPTFCALEYFLLGDPIRFEFE